MKLVQFQDREGGEVRPGLLTPRGIVDMAEAVGGPARTMNGIVDGFDAMRGDLARLDAEGDAIPLDRVRLRAPLPRPGKMLCCIGNYREHRERDPRPLNMFLKNHDAVIGPGDTVMLPETTEPWAFHHEAELALVVKGPARRVRREHWREAVFGYTCLIDVSARGEGRSTWRARSWMGKSFDTFAPLGPCIVTADEIADPNDLDVRFRVSGELRHDYNTADMEHPVPELVAWASAIMTLNSGDVIGCGTNHEGLGPLQDGDRAEIEIAGIGRMEVGVADPLKRSWKRGVYMGPDSTHPDNPDPEEPSWR